MERERQDVLEELADRIAAQADKDSVRTPKWLIGIGLTALTASLGIAAWYGSITFQVPANSRLAESNAKAIQEIEKDLTHLCASSAVSCRRKP